MASVQEPDSLPGHLPPTDVRFGVRSLLVAMLVFALTAAVLGVVLRRLSVEDQIRGLVICTVVVVLLTGCFVYAGWQRRRVELRAGTPRFVLTRHSYLFPRAPRLAAILLGSISLIASIVSIVGSTLVFAPHALPSLAWHLFWAVTYGSIGIALLWWNRADRICDVGVLTRNKLIPWEECARYYWDGCYRDVMVLEWKKDSRIALRVPADMRETLQEFLSQRFAGN